MSLADGTPDAAWNPAPSDFVRSLACAGGFVYAGGWFTQIGGASLSYVARLNATNGAADLTWNPQPDNSVDVIIPDVSTVYLGGSFSTLQAQPFPCLGRVNITDGVPDPTWVDTNLSGTVEAFIFGGGSQAYMAGDFTTLAGGQIVRHLASISLMDASIDTTWLPQFDDAIQAMALSGGNVYAGGGFTQLGTQTMVSVACISGLDATPVWSPGPRFLNPGNAYDIYVQADGKVLVGGNILAFTPGGDRRSMLRLLPDGTLDTAWAPPALGDGFVNIFAVYNNDVYVGGSFRTLGGAPIEGLARLDGRTGALNTNWVPNINGSVTDMEIASGLLYVGGNFSFYSGSTNVNAVRFNLSSGALDPSWSANSGGGSVWGLSVVDGYVYLAGSFTLVCGQAVARLARVDTATGSLDTGWRPEPDNMVYDVLPAAEGIYACGSFTTLGGQPRQTLGRVSATDGSAHSWNAGISAGSLGYEVATDGSYLYVANIGSAGSRYVGGACRFSRTTGALSTNWFPGTGNPYSVAVRGKRVYLAGSISVAAGEPRIGFAALYGGACATSFRTSQVSDLAVFDNNTGAWYVSPVAGGAPIAWNMPWGWPGAVPVPGDYDGDNVLDLAVFDSNTGNWYVRKVVGGDSLVWAVAWGWPGAIPVSGDYDGDFVSDLAVFDNAAGTWYVRGVAGGDPLVWAMPWGWPGARPVAGDYNNNGLSDLAVFDNNTGTWFVRDLVAGTLVWNVAWGWPGAIPVPGDYDGDGSADLAVFDSNTGNWYVLKAAGGDPLVWAHPWGWAGAIPVPGDFDGDGNSDLAVFHSVTGGWYVYSLAGTILAWGTPWGWSGAVPVGCATR